MADHKKKAAAVKDYVEVEGEKVAASDLLKALVHRNCAGDVRVAKSYLGGDVQRLILEVEETRDGDGYELRTYLTPPKADDDGDEA